MRTAMLVLAVLVGAAAAPAAAGADGLPVPVEDTGPTGIASPDGRTRLVTVRVGKDTLVQRTVQDGGQIEDSRFVPGKFTIPAVALDATAAGLSHDESTIVLIRPRASFPRAKTTFAIMDAPRLRVRRIVTLRGDFSFDAVSPDGATIYLIQYVDPGDPTNYLVRGLDSATGRLQPRAIVDPHETGDEMRGFALTRATSPDGSWEYTLYDGMGQHPFVHALDVKRGRARCIDLPAGLANTDVSQLRLAVAPDGGRVDVTRGADSVAVIDTETFAVSEPGSRRPADSPRRGGDGGDGGIPWTAPAALGLVLLSAAAIGIRRRTRTTVHVP
jgi:hypothetical protein